MWWGGYPLKERTPPSKFWDFWYSWDLRFFIILKVHINIFQNFFTGWKNIIFRKDMVVWKLKLSLSLYIWGIFNRVFLSLSIFRQFKFLSRSFVSCFQYFALKFWTKLHKANFEGMSEAFFGYFLFSQIYGVLRDWGTAVNINGIFQLP